MKLGASQFPTLVTFCYFCTVKYTLAQSRYGSPTLNDKVAILDSENSTTYYSCIKNWPLKAVPCLPPPSFLVLMAPRGGLRRRCPRLGTQGASKQAVIGEEEKGIVVPSRV